MDNLIDFITWLFHWVIMTDAKIIHNLIHTGHMGLTNVHGQPIGFGWYLMIAYVNGFFLGIAMIPSAVVAFILGWRKTALVLFIVGVALVMLFFSLIFKKVPQQNDQVRQ